MRTVHIKDKTSIEVNQSYEGEPLEAKIQKITTAKEPIESVSPIVYTEKKDGVLPQYDIRTDRFEIARKAMDEVNEKFRKGKLSEIAKGTPNMASESINAEPTEDQ